MKRVYIVIWRNIIMAVFSTEELAWNYIDTELEGVGHIDICNVDNPLLTDKQ